MTSDGENLSVRTKCYLDRGIQTNQRIGWLLERAADRWPHSRAVTFEGETLTYLQLARWTRVVARFLIEAGLKPGDRLLMHASSSLECRVLHLAAWRIGICMIGAIPVYREHELRQILDEFRPTAVATTLRYAERTPPAEFDRVLDELGQGDRVKFVIGGSCEGWTSIPPRPDEAIHLEDADLPDPAPAHECCLIYFTSGTTAGPKGVMHNSRSLIAMASAWRERLQFTSADCAMTGLPFARLATLLATYILPALCGARAVVLREWTPAEAVVACEAEAVTFCCGAPLFLSDIVALYEQGASPTHRLKMFEAGAAPVAPQLVARAEAMGIQAWRSYGMTESPMITAGSRFDVAEARAYGDGKVTEGGEIEIVDESRRPVSLGQLGEIRLRSPYQMIGYSNPEHQAANVDAEGWLYTGDLGELKPDGTLIVSGRMKDWINRGGEKFMSMEIEQLISTHSGVGAVAVIGVPDTRWGQAVAAFVVPKPQQIWPGQDALVEHLLSKKVDRRKIPAYWEVVDSLPTTISGKLHKHRLLEIWEQSMAADPAGKRKASVVTMDPNA